MRLLSKYCTWRVPPGESAYGSVSSLEMPSGPQIQVWTASPSATGRSLRSQTRWKCSLDGATAPALLKASSASSSEKAVSAAPACSDRERGIADLMGSSNPPIIVLPSSCTQTIGLETGNPAAPGGARPAWRGRDASSCAPDRAGHAAPEEPQAPPPLIARPRP